MRDIRQIIQRVPLLTNGMALIGLVLLLAGIVVTWGGVLKLRTLWIEFSPYFPISFSDVTPARVFVSVPLIVKVFIVLVSSICAVLIGALWAFSGLAEMIRSRKKDFNAADLDHPALVAGSLREAQSEYWRSSSWILRKFTSLLPRARFITPVSYEILKDLGRTSAKLIAVGFVIALVVYLLQLTPLLLKKYLQITLEIVVPSATPLYALLGFLILADAIIAVSMVPLRRHEFVSSCHIVPVKGAGDPHLFFSLLEEGCRLLSPKGLPDRRPVRLEQEAAPTTKGTLIESYPETVKAFSRPAAYACLPFVFLLLTMGFSRLTDFHRPVAPMHYADFLAYHALDYVLEVAFALGLILAGLNLAELARRMFAVHRFRSALVFCYAVKGDRDSNSGTSPKQPLGPPGPVKWKVVQGVDDQFAGWAKDPASQRKFSVQLCWAEASSEASEAGAPRFLIRLGKSPSLDEAMQHLSELPFHVDFQADPALLPDKGPSPSTS